MMRLLILVLLLTATAGCAAGPDPFDAAVPSVVCSPRTHAQETTIKSEAGEYDIRTPDGGYMRSGTIGAVRWSWGDRVPVQVEVEATWQDGPLGAEPMRVALGEPYDGPLYADAHGLSPLRVRFTLEEPPTTTHLRVWVEPSAEPAPAGAAVVLVERDTHVVVRQTLPCP